MNAARALDQGLAGLTLALPAEARGKLVAYLELLAKWNRTYNLTAIRDPQDMVTHHLLDSLSVIAHLPMRAGCALADVGSGGGLPGIPLAIAQPQWRVTVNDASEKKSAFLRQASFELGLGNLTVHEGRVEAWQPLERFSVVISRAFAELAQFISSCRHLLAPGGTLAAMKSLRAPRELERVPQGWSCEVVSLTVPMLPADRTLVLCRPE